MISRRDKLLNKPWEQRRYNNHIHKVQSAVPVIDNKPPITREHVSIKSKKRQKEIERMRQIENENLILLRRINFVMNTNRVDNWNIPPQQARFLKRVPLSYPSRPASHNGIISHAESIDTNHNHLRKSKCNACSPHTIPPKEKDSERIPWEEPKMYSKYLNRTRSKSLPLIAPPKSLQQKDKVEEAQNMIVASAGTTKKMPRLIHEGKLKKNRSFEQDAPQKLVISRGSLKLCVKFPSDTQITLKDGCMEKIVFGNHNNCTCKL